MEQPSERINPYLSLPPEYPAPPRVHWFLLVLGWWALTTLIEWFAPTAYQSLLESLVIDAWAFYFCVWIRTLNPDSASFFWCEAYVIVEITSAALSIWRHPSPLLQWSIVGLGVASGILGFVTIYLVRAELLKHYNEREPMGLTLGSVMTFFLSFVYFQYHLNAVSAFKKRQAEVLATNPSRNLLP